MGVKNQIVEYTGGGEGWISEAHTLKIKNPEL